MTNVTIVVSLNEGCDLDVVCNRLERARQTHITQLRKLGLEVRDNPMPVPVKSSKTGDRIDYIVVVEHDVTEQQADIVIRGSGVLEKLDAIEGVDYTSIER